MRLCVDGTDDHGAQAGDGESAPFFVFNIDRQENVAGPFDTRSEAGRALQLQQMLVLAAKAVGYDINFSEPINGYYPHGYNDQGDVEAYWDPSRSDGDSRRLQIAAGVTLVTGSAGLAAYPPKGGLFDAMAPCGEQYADHGGDKDAAARAAVLKCVAELGRRLP